MFPIGVVCVHICVCIYAYCVYIVCKRMSVYTQYVYT